MGAYRKKLLTDLEQGREAIARDLAGSSDKGAQLPDNEDRLHRHITTLELLVDEIETRLGIWRGAFLVVFYLAVVLLVCELTNSEPF
jgi:hypothetical protein